MHTPTIGILAIRYKTDYMISKVVFDWISTQVCNVIYLSPKMSDMEWVTVLKNLDGVIFPGGEDQPVPQNRTYRLAKKIMSAAVGRRIPIIGMCLGLQYLLTFFSGDTWEHIHTKVHSRGVANRLHLCENVELPIDTKIHYIFNHTNAITTESFSKNPQLPQIFDVLTTSQHNGYHYVSTIQGKQLPLFGTQWHPEAAEHTSNPRANIPRSLESIKTGRIIIRHFMENVVREMSARQKFPSKAFLQKYAISTLEFRRHPTPEKMAYVDYYEYYVLPKE
jgi:gamma-glutamyl-gamma-aminobutyrate hydrolase PuuD